MAAVPALFLFTLFAYLNVAGLTRSETEALAKTIASEPTFRTASHFVVFADGGAMASRLQKRRSICTLNRKQVKRLAREFRIERIRMRVRGRRVTIIVVHDVDRKKELRRAMKARELRCRLVHRGQTFFFPFNPQIS